MTDPLSLSGTAVGIVSLGISVTQGLVEYYGAWKSYDSDLKDLNQQLNQFKTLLESLSDHLVRTPVSATAFSTGRVQECILSCSGGLTKLEKMLMKCQRVKIPRTPIEKVELFGQRILFPFKRSTLKDMAGTIGGLQTNLGTALQILQLDILGSISTTGNEVSSKISTSNTQLNVVNRSLQTVIPQIHQTTDGIQLLNVNTQTISTTLESCEGKLQKLEENLNILHQSIRQNSWQPDALRSAILQASYLETDSRLLITRDPQTKQLRTRPRYLKCSCLLPSQTRSKYWVGPMLFHSHTVGSHSKDCPAAALSARTETYNIRLSSCNSFLSGVVEFTLSLKRGAGGFTIAPSLNCRNVVSGDNPAIRILQAFPSRLYRKPNVDKSSTAQESLQHLQGVVEGQLASLVDTDSSGNNLMHLACDLVRFAEPTNLDMFQYYRDLISGLVWMGVQVDEIREDGRTALDLLTSWYFFLYSNSGMWMYSKVVDTQIFDDTHLENYDELPFVSNSLEYYNNHGKLYDRPAIRHRLSVPNDFRSGEALSSIASLSMLLVNNGATTFMWCDVKSSGDIEIAGAYMRQMMQLGCPIEAFEGGDLSKAIFSHSIHDLARILRASPSSVHERDKWDHNSLHLGSNWPEGISLLLSSGADPNATAKNYETPLTYACSLNCAASVKLLIDGGSGVTELVLKSAFQHNNPEILDAVITGLYNQREKLRRLALDELPRKILENLQLRSDLILDRQAPLVCQALEDAGIKINGEVYVEQDHPTVYQIPLLKFDIAEKLYTLGFRDITGSSLVQGRVSRPHYSRDDAPSVWKDRLRLLSWLISKGSRELGYAISGSLYGKLSYTPLHLEAAIVGSNLYRGFANDDNPKRHYVSTILEIEDDYKDAVLAILTTEVYDNCECPCSPGGCTPLSTMLKEVDLKLDVGEEGTIRDVQTWVIQWLARFLGKDHPEWSWIGPTIVRSKVYASMNFAHTCCNLSYSTRSKYMSRQPDDGLEKERTEWKAYFKRMEHIIAVLESDISNSTLHFADYFSRHFQPRLKELLARQFQGGELEIFQRIRPKNPQPPLQKSKCMIS